MIILKWKNAEKARSVVFVGFGALLGLALSWLVNEYTVAVWPQFMEWPAGVFYLSYLWLMYLLSRKLIKRRCMKAGCEGAYDEEPWLQARKRESTRFTCNTCGHIRNVPFPDWTTNLWS